ncbi:MAG: hypothetical protein GY795_19615 [Desulfobacterales bacterium]|nr:hypothetical protein [Desulfobacterales bacterium]
MNYDGTDWKEITSVTSAQLISGVWGCSGNEMFAAGNKGTILHYDGTAWTEMENESSQNNLLSIWGSSCDKRHSPACNPPAATGFNHCIYMPDSCSVCKIRPLCQPSSIL